MRKHKQYPPTHVSPGLVRRVDMAVYTVGILSLLCALDQVRLVWVAGHADGVSLLAWGFTVVSGAVWCWYGIVHRDSVLMVINILWIAVGLSVVAGVVILA